MEVMITSGINATDKYFDFLEQVIRVNIRDLVLESRTINPNEKYDKFDIVTDFIRRCKGDVLIGNIVNSYKDFLHLQEKIAGSNIKVKKAYIKYDDSYDDYKILYEKHSRWLDYSPDYIRLKQEEHNRELEKLGDFLKSESIEVIYIHPSSA